MNDSTNDRTAPRRSGSNRGLLPGRDSTVREVVAREADPVFVEAIVEAISPAVDFVRRTSLFAESARRHEEKESGENHHSSQPCLKRRAILAERARSGEYQRRRRRIARRRWQRSLSFSEATQCVLREERRERLSGMKRLVLGCHGHDFAWSCSCSSRRHVTLGWPGLLLFGPVAAGPRSFESTFDGVERSIFINARAEASCASHLA